jgi:DnaJ-class molecular chaperone
MASCTSLYEILGIASASSDQEIKAAYRRLARVSHPDVAAIDRKDSSADEFMKIHAAYSTLSDPEERASYDRSLFRRQQPLTAIRFSGHGCRNWETDQCW